MINFYLHEDPSNMEEDEFILKVSRAQAMREIEWEVQGFKKPPPKKG